MYFGARLSAPLAELKLDRDEAPDFRLIDPVDFESAPIAFESARKALLAWRGMRG